MNDIDRRFNEIHKFVLALRDKDAGSMTAAEKIQLATWSSAVLADSLNDMFGGAAKRNEARADIHSLADRWKHVAKCMTGRYRVEARLERRRIAIEQYEQAAQIGQAMEKTAAEGARIEDEFKQRRAEEDRREGQRRSRYAEAIKSVAALPENIKVSGPLKLRRVSARI